MGARLPKHLFDAHLAATLPQQFCAGLDLATCAADVMVRSAVERQPEILGEAARRALDEAPSLRDEIPAPALAVALRKRIIHGHDRVERQVVFDAVQRDLPPLINAIAEALSPLPVPGSADR